MVTMKYSEISGFQFVQSVQKIASAPTHGKTASEIHKVMKQIEYARSRIQKEYQNEIAIPFAKKDAEGNIVRPEGEPNGFTPDEARQEEFMKAQEAFGQKLVELDANPFTESTIASLHNISAGDLEMLKGLWVGNSVASEVNSEGPGVPKVSNVASIR